MKIQVRKNIFETNSSSIHSLVIGNNNENIYENLPTEIHFNGGEYGWENEVYNDIENKANYLYTGIVKNNLVDELVPKIKDILSKWNITPIFQETNKKMYNNEEYDEFKHGYYYIDHSYDLQDFLNTVCNNEELLMNFLFSDGSFIETGNDNDDDEWIDFKYPENVLLEYEKGN